MKSMCGAPGMTLNRAPGIALAIASTMGGGADLSSSPAMHSVGTRIACAKARREPAIERCFDDDLHAALLSVGAAFLGDSPVLGD